MDGYHIYPDPALGGKTPWPLIASSLWLRLGFVAATGVVVALTELYKGELNVLAALAWIFGSAWLTALSWRRAKFLLDRLDGFDGAPEAAASGVIASEQQRIQVGTGARSARRPPDRNSAVSPALLHFINGSTGSIRPGRTRCRP
jgi:hypothetical protein